MRHGRQQVAREQKPKCTAEEDGEKKGAQKAHGQIELLHERDEEREGVLVCRVEDELMKACVELAIVRKARGVEDGKGGEGKRTRHAPGQGFERCVEKTRERGGDERKERQKPRCLTA